MVGMMNAYNVPVENSEGKRPLRRAKSKWEDNIRIDLKCKFVGVDC
jgi:hypothetical protein